MSNKILIHFSETGKISNVSSDLYQGRCYEIYFHPYYSASQVISGGASHLLVR